MKFLKPCTREELRIQLTTVEAKLDEGWQRAREYEEMADQRRKMVIREENKKRQQKHRQQQHQHKIARGERSPGGTKRNLKVCSYQIPT
jgi:YesN/AraC family two-component response regulator